MKYTRLLQKVHRNMELNNIELKDYYYCFSVKIEMHAYFFIIHVLHKYFEDFS